MDFEFNLRTKTIVGKGSLSKVPEYLRENGYSRAGLIIDQSMKNNKFVVEFIELLKKEKKVAVLWFYDLSFEPDYISLDKIKLLFKSNENSLVDVLIAIGGGSVMDFGKGIATLINNHEPALNYRGFPKGLNPSIPLIAIPTTAGTASEVTFNAVFTDTISEKKMGINTHNNFPALAVLDSNMTLGCPFSVALSSGLDALVHTFESFACKKHNRYTRMFAKEAFALLFKNMEKALSDPNADEARENMLFGAYLAGVSLFNAGSGPAGAISYPLGVVFKVPHGIAGGFILPYLIQFNVEQGYTEYAELYDQISDKNQLTSTEKSNELVKEFFSLYKRLDVRGSAKKFNIDLTNPGFIEYVELLQGAFDQNPVPFYKENAMSILSEIFS